MDIGGNKLKAVQSSLDMINGRIDQTTGLINKANVAVKTAKRYNSFTSCAAAAASVFFIVRYYGYVCNEMTAN